MEPSVEPKPEIVKDLNGRPLLWPPHPPDGAVLARPTLSSMSRERFLKMRQRIATSPRNKHKTDQTIATPWELFTPLHDLLNFKVDLAANDVNSKCPVFINERLDSLSDAVQWRRVAGVKEWLWLNPPFKNIDPWAKKCLHESRLGANVVMLVPASVGAGWFFDHIFARAIVVFLRGRIIFDFVQTTGAKRGEWNTDPYPKDCMLCVFSKDIVPQFTWMDWRSTVQPLADALAVAKEEPVNLLPAPPTVKV